MCAVLVWADDFICSGTRTNFYRVGTFSCLLCSCINVISHAVRWLLEHAIRCVQKSKSIHIFCRGENVIFWKAECQQIWTEVEYFVSNNIRTYYIKLSIYFDFSMLWNCWKCSDHTSQKQYYAKQNKDKNICTFFKYFSKCWRHIRAFFESSSDDDDDDMMMMISPSCWVFL